MARSISERIDELDKKQAELKAQKKALKARQSQQERKERTKRLIETGAAFEKAFDREFGTKEEREKLIKFLTDSRIDQNGYPYTYASWLMQLYDNEQ